MVPTPTIVVNPPFDKAGSLASIPSHGHSVNEDAITPVEPLKSTPRMEKGKKLAKKGFQRKRKQVVSVESDKSIP